MKKSIVLILVIFTVSSMLFLFSGCKESDIPIDTGFTGRVWTLQYIDYSGIGQITLDGEYWVRFEDDGSFTMGADCNECGGTYTLGTNGEMNFPDSFFCTEVACGTDSDDTEFRTAMDRVIGYRYDATDGSYIALYFIDQNNWLYFER